jgi:transposase InsO family protein
MLEVVDGRVAILPRASPNTRAFERLLGPFGGLHQDLEGQQYCNHYKMQPYRAMLARNGVKQSMSRKGNCFDNAAIESFFGTQKIKYFRLAGPNTIDQIEEGVHD